jgi:hypothetical protein
MFILIFRFFRSITRRLLFSWLTYPLLIALEGEQYPLEKDESIWNSDKYFLLEEVAKTSKEFVRGLSIPI